MKNKLLSLLLAVAMVCSLTAPMTSAYAESDLNAAAVQAAAVAAEAAPEADATVTETVAEAAPEDEAAATDVTEEAATESEAQAAVAEAAAAAENAPADSAAVDEQTVEAPVAEEAAEEIATVEEEAAADSEVTELDEDTVVSLRPMAETNMLYITLIGYTKEQLQHFSVDDVITKMTDKAGNKVTIGEGYTHVWFYFGNSEAEEFHALNNKETVDLWNYGSNIYVEDGKYYNTSMSFTMVLNQGSQFNGATAHRYKGTIEEILGSKATGYFTVGYAASNKEKADEYAYGYRQEKSVFESLSMPGQELVIIDADHADGNDYRVKLDDSSVKQLRRIGVRTEIFPMAKFLAHRDNGAKLEGAINDAIFSDEGIVGKFDTDVNETNYPTADNLWVVAFRAGDTGRVMGYFGLSIKIQKEAVIKGELWTDENGTRTKVDSDSSIGGIQSSWELDFASQGNGAKASTSNYYGYVGGTMFNFGQTYYFAMQKTPEINKVFLGSFASLEKAQEAGATDVSASVLYEKGQIPTGYGDTFEKSTYFTVVLTNGRVEHYIAKIDDAKTTQSKTSADPYFQISGASGMRKNTYGNSYLNYLSSYSASTVDGYALDTYYRGDGKYEIDGYQLLLINGSATDYYPDWLGDADFKNLVPRFWVPEGVTVNSGSKVESGKTDLQNAKMSDEIANTVAYQVHVPGEKLKNYMVTFAFKQPEASLFVAGPDKRYLDISAQNNYIHDILVANLGATDLTGVKVELINPVHIKLDNYWTIGGDGNDTIPAFTETTPKFDDGSGKKPEDQYDSALANIAKVRLCADGEGEISGTLRITAANGQSRDIVLTGNAEGPHIISGALDDAVKYVPYSYMIATNNMYSSNRATYKLTSGALPDGLKLYEATGEIYGIPTTPGIYTFSVQVDYSNIGFASSSATYTLAVHANTNANVYNESDNGYAIKTVLGTEQGAGTYDYYLTDTSTDQLYVSNGVLPEFVNLWLNGEKLERGKDYTVVSGSTRITIKSQTFDTKASKDSYNTIAAEFRVDGSRANELKRTAQNFRLSENVPEPVDDLKPAAPVAPVAPAVTAAPAVSQTKPSSGSDKKDGSSANNDNNSTAPAAAAQPVVVTTAQGVTMNCYFVDANNTPLAGVTAELHSTPRTAVTNNGGLASYAAVEFGAHTLTVSNSAGVMASKAFNLVPGTAAAISGDTVTAVDGSSMTLRIKVSNGSMSFVSASVPKTGDTFNYGLLLLMMAVSATALVGVYLLKKKHNKV